MRIGCVLQGRRELDVDGKCFIFPTTSPVQFDPPTLRWSIDMLANYAPGANG